MDEQPPLMTAVDLRAPADDPLTTASVPPGWEAVAAVARRVAADLDRLTDRVVARIDLEIPAYAAPASVPREDLAASIYRTLEMMLLGVVEHRGPHPDEVQIRGELGRRRAVQGLPVGVLIDAYHIGYQELWHALVGALPDGDPETAAQLLPAATTVWSWVHAVSNAIAEAHIETTRARDANVVAARQRFTELLATGDPGSDEMAQLTAAIGFEVDGQFRVTVARATPLDGTEARRLQSALRTAAGVHVAVARGPQVIVTSQDADEDELTATIARVLPQATCGLGVVRDGLDGARQSLGDAERAAAVAAPGTLARFQDEWLWATLLRAAPRLYEVLAPGADTAVQHPHLAETVLAFADSGFSVSETARQLELHANTVAYRLERWHALTGWDPRTFPGLTRSLAALRLSTE